MIDDPIETIPPYLLPNEDVEFVCRIQSGFIVLTNRRFVLMKKGKQDGYRIEKAIPHDCIFSIKEKKIDRFEISGTVLDTYGQHTNEVWSFDVIAPSKDYVEFSSAMNQCFSIVEGIRNSDAFLGETPPLRDYSYLDHMPESLTKNAMLDLNTILRDQPIPDALVHEAEEFLGANPFIIEESLRDGNDIENGVLFAAGAKGYFWIQGRKHGRFIGNVIVDTVEWDNIRCFAYQWQSDIDTIFATYSLTGDGKESMTQYQWSPTIDEDTLQFPWLLQKLNGPWILADISYKYSGRPLPASWNVTQSDRYLQRYYH